jgi:hypothetical protein
MKYLTKELHDGDDTAAWKHNLKAYADQLGLLRPRLSKRAYEFFARISLHDGTLISLTVGDAIETSLGELSSLSRNARKAKVVLRLLNYEQDSLYTLRFTRIRRVLIESRLEEPRPVIDDFLYGELTPADESHLCYRILFSSGTLIAIEFKRFSYEREQVPNSSGPVYA